MSHIEVCPSAGFCSFTGTHLGRNAWAGLWAQLLLIRSDDCTHFLQDPWSLSSYQEPSQRDEIPPPNPAKSCIFEGTAICQRIKAESQGTAAQRSNLSIRGQILPAVDCMRWAKMVRGDNSGNSSSFAAKLSPWWHRWKTSSQEHQATGREWRLRFFNLNKHAKQISSWHLQSHFANIGSWKAGSPTSNPPWMYDYMLNLQNYSVFCSGHIETSEIAIFLNKSWRPQLRDQTFCFTV